MSAEDSNQDQNHQQNAGTAASSVPTLPNYPELITEAIEALNDKEGSTKTAISKQIEATHDDLPAAHSTLLSHHLNKMKQSGQLVMVKNNYVLAGSAPPKRGRGRPPKPKDLNATPTPSGPPRPRGRPRKSDPLGVSSKSKTKTSSGRPRGRPPKPKPATPVAAPSSAANPDAGTPGLTPAAAMPRGRGRPPKVKPAAAPLAG